MKLCTNRTESLEDTLSQDDVVLHRKKWFHSSYEHLTVTNTVSWVSCRHHVI